MRKYPVSSTITFEDYPKQFLSPGLTLHRHVETFESDFGGTETLKAVEGCFKMRKTDNLTEMILLTDGDIWGQQDFFSYVSKNTVKGDVRIFPLGIGRGVSSALIEGVARVGRGFAQMVADNEKMDRKIVRMVSTKNGFCTSAGTTDIPQS